MNIYVYFLFSVNRVLLVGCALRCRVTSVLAYIERKLFAAWLVSPQNNTIYSLRNGWYMLERGC